MADTFDPNAYLANAAAKPATQGFDPDAYLKEAKYSTPGQMIKTGLEGAAEGVAGPLADLFETKLGIATPEDIQGRRDTNPITHGAGNVAGFAGSIAGGVGLGKVAAGAGLAATDALGLSSAVGRAAGIAPELSTVAKIASRGVQTGAEMAALSTSDELSKMVTNQPGQTIGNAAVHIGLNGLLGGVVGGTLGAISPLFKAGTEKLGIAQTIDDAKAQFEFRQNNPDPLAGATGELQDRISSMDGLRGMKTEPLLAAMPEATEANIAKVDAHIQDISDQVTSKLEAASKSVKTRSAVPYLSEDLNNFHEAVTQPNASIGEKFQALDKLKTDLQGYAKWAGTEEGSAKGVLGAQMSSIIKPALEDSSVWGEAGNIQRKANSAISEFLTANKPLLQKFTSKIGGDAVVDSGKVNSFLNNAGKPSASIKANALSEYLDKSQKLADTIKEIYNKAGLEVPEEANLNPAAVINNNLGKTTVGSQLGDWMYDKGAASAVGSGLGTGIGGIAGSAVGHPAIGAALGAKFLGPSITALAKPLIESATNSIGIKSAAKYVSSAAAGQSLLSNAAKSFFKASSQVIPEQLIPKAAALKDLSDRIDHLASNFNSQLEIGQNLQHYMPDHAQAAASTAGAAIGYLQSLKPTQPQMSPLDTPGVISKAAQYKYDRQLAIAQQPLMVLKHAADGTLIPQDITTIKTIYPTVLANMQQNLSQELIQHTSGGSIVPYKQRYGLGMILGQPIDSTMTQGALQSAIHANAGASAAAQAQNASPKPHKQSQANISQQEKVNSMSATPLQARAMQRKET